jgi:hypothetical protein
MRPARPIGALIGLLAIGGLAAGCGAGAKHPIASAQSRRPPPLDARSQMLLSS